MEKSKKLFVSIICMGAFLSVLLIANLVLTICQMTHGITSEKIYQNSLKTVVELKAFNDADTVSYGTAVCIKNDGTFVTNAHVVSYKEMTLDKTFESIEVRFASDENYMSASLEKIDYEKDLALVKVNIDKKNIKAARTRTSKLNEGEKVFAIGNAQNYGISIIDGIISQAELIVNADGKTIKAIQCSLNITDGNSGGALYDANGLLIGITTFRLKDKIGNVIYGISFAIPIKQVIEF